MFSKLLRLLFSSSPKPNLGRWSNVGCFKKDNYCITESTKSYAYDCAKEFN